IAGPPGLALGAVAGGALGAVAGNRVAESADKRDDLGHFQQIFHTMPYYIAGRDWHDYAPAYRYGLDTFERHRGLSFSAAESQLQGGWEAAARFGSRLGWFEAKPAVEHAWQSLQETLDPTTPHQRVEDR
ncbi:MAG: hypothetical protein M3Q96_03860, partial [Pseudomonadota bacterium]|nr:hypothetical protein [Pseudomonadota bacterium]